MLLELTAEQDQMQRALRVLFARRAGWERARSLGGEVDRELLAALAAAGYLDLAAPGDDGGGGEVAVGGGTLLDAVLMVEEAEAASACAPVAARAVVAATLLEEPPVVMGLVDPDRSALTRWAGTCDGYLVLGEGDRSAAYAAAADVEVTPVPTRWGYPLGRVTVRRSEPLGPGSGARLVNAWRIALAAEMGGAMRRAVDLTAAYVTNRRQFGRPIGSYQAVSHALGEAAVATEGTVWLARKAAANPEDGVMAAAAATYAADAARIVGQQTHQVTGAIGITLDYGLVASTMRLGVLRSELGGARRHAVALSELRWAAA